MHQHRTELTLDAAFRLLASPERRSVLRQLIDATGSVTIGGLADGLLKGQNGGPDAQSREKVVLELYHLHLPRLRDAGLVSFDTETGEVRYHPDERVERLLRAVNKL